MRSYSAIFAWCLMLVFCTCIRSFAASHSSPADELTRLARDADIFVIEFYADSTKKKIIAVDKTWILRLAQALQVIEYEPGSYCFCISYPIVHLYRGDERLLTFSVHHGDRLRFKTSDDVNHDFIIGPAAGKHLVSLALERKGG
ncbi:MAG: hypothetical protein JNK23_23240 [Opitutaceae bacterium]|nr:hypothetical protein [Opitutaceae bacterium]